jgi:hypothetical protein
MPDGRSNYADYLAEDHRDYEPPEFVPLRTLVEREEAAEPRLGASAQLPGSGRVP